MTPPRELRCTYRLQLGPQLDLRGARALVPYLRQLGVSHLYLSPVMEATHGSSHGYDVVDPTRVRTELGGEDELRALAAEGLGLVLDVVPNHMATDETNPFWRDALWRAKFFDLDWRTGVHRRFFDVGELAGVRVEDPEVFETTHRKTIELVHDGVVDGLRIDHPDGLANPARYLRRLAEAGVERVWVEKILEPGERLRGWPVEGTTGYDFMADATALHVDPEAEAPLTQLYGELTGERRSFADVAYEAKLEQARTTFADEVERLELLLPEDLAAEVDLAEALASFPVYRTYVDVDEGLVVEADREAVERARLHPRLAALLSLEERGRDAFVVRWQQTTPPVTAKGVEDTAFYRYNRLLALNEVGGDPGRFSLSVEAFHAAAAERGARSPRSLLATTTHDTKRSADVRARLVAISARPEAWGELVARARETVAWEIDANDGYLVLQTLVGAWPLGADRLERYLQKALREGKRRTSWLSPDEEYEAATSRLAAELVAHRGFRPAFDRFLDGLSLEAERVSLGTVVLKLTCPGVPDLYQGDEAPFLALVDPDNRRPVDWRALRAGLAAPEPGSKVDVIRRLLALRSRRPGAFGAGYEPLAAGPSTCAFVRGGEVAVAVALRGSVPTLDLPGEWRDVLPPHRHRRVLERV